MASDLVNLELEDEHNLHFGSDIRFRLYTWTRT
jgi:hypothetical protein